MAAHPPPAAVSTPGTAPGPLACCSSTAPRAWDASPPQPKGNGMNGAKGLTNGALPATSGAALSPDDLKQIATAREHFAAGADTVHGVRSEILVSWYRCREEYEVDPGLERAPAAAEGSGHSMGHDVVFAELGGWAACAAGEGDGLDGLVTVADCDRRGPA